MFSANPTDLMGTWRLFKFNTNDIDTFFGENDNWVEWTFKENGTAFYRYKHQGAIITDNMPRFWKLEDGDIWLYAKKKKMFKVLSITDEVLALKLAKANMTSYCRKTAASSGRVQPNKK